ncbi:MAG: 6-carboxytetrahydropterin synthase QueD [Clostridiales bacterium]|nr:6-carboxytetrahydropterin synthase QueD [Clostridiales bacterium]
MYYLKTEQSFDAAHFLKDYQGKCRNLHGHRWRVVAEIQGENLDAERQTRGMLVDFGELKELLKILCDTLDHSLIYETGSLRPETLAALKEEGFRMVPVPFRPTAEEFARYFYRAIRQRGYAVHRVEVYETPNNCAAYEGEP